MNGLELSRKYFEDFGRPMLERDFADILPLLAAGFTGSGSERYGFDDDISKDHDFEPGFCIFLPGEDLVDRRRAFQLERAYAKLPREYMGAERQPLSPVGGNRNGVMRTEEYYLSAVGSSTGELTAAQWLSTPDCALAEAVNGEIFFDNLGEVSAIRSRLENMPEDVRLKRIAGNLLVMAQAGQYNYTRCLSHGEPEAAQLACVRFVDSALKVIFLLRGKYLPYYKWSFRALRSLEGAEKYADRLSSLLSGGIADPAQTEKKYAAVECIASDIITELTASGLTRAVCGDLEKHAYSVNDKISDPTVRNLHILTTVGY